MTTTLFHGSPRADLTQLDPSHCIIDPADWAGVSVVGIKQTDPVVWLTPDFDIAVAFALKGHVQDLAIDPHAGVLYLQGTPVSSEIHGYVYQVTVTATCVEVNPLEWVSLHPVDTAKKIRVTANSFRRLQPQWVTALPEPPSP